VALAARGARNMDGGDETIGNEADRARLRRQARAVHLRSLLAAAILTALSLATPD
jgi:hypothetical protein